MTTKRFAYQPALDGVRALAVTVVLLFHAGVPGFGGGYVGVSVFFTLSGFLITSLLIREHRAEGRIDVSGFYARRARRLLPASALCLVAVVVLADLGAWDQVAHLRRDVWAAALQVFNWLRLTGTTSYGDLFSQTGGQVSPLEHYWSLAIEEQFYWVWPLAFAGLAGLALRIRRSLIVVLGVPALVAVVAAPVIAAVFGPEAAYWSTAARVGEILTGAVAAAVVAERGAPRWARRAAPACLGLIGLAVVFFPSASGPAYRGWLPALSVVTVVLLLGLQHEGGLRAGLSVRPLVALGAISYGVYLFHWPIFTLVDEARLGRGGIVLLAVRLGLTLLVAIASYRLIERPVRLDRRAPRPTLVAGGALTVAILALALTLPDNAVTIDTAGDAKEAAAIRPGGAASELTTSGPVLAPDQWRQATLPAPATDRPVRILVLGDSTAEATGGGLVRWAAAHPDQAQVTIEAAPGCGFVQGGTRVFPQGDQEISATCAAYVDEVIGAKVAELQPDVVMVMTTAWDVINQRFEGTGPQAPTDPEYRRRIGAGFAAATEAVLAAGAPRVVWIAEPPVNPFWNPVPSPQEEPERHQVLHDTMSDLAAERPDQVAVADLAWWIDDAGLAEDRAARPDGVHLSAGAAEQVATSWLGPLLVHAALTGR
ncbi:acyltransferase family protein [Aquihabitans daechungensis]|uniref:acyltransferase family protein n=1 Tax=Aquihabitans daechungensis TaxID=1052257 RepID=UPI003BA1D727